MNPDPVSPQNPLNTPGGPAPATNNVTPSSQPAPPPVNPMPLAQTGAPTPLPNAGVPQPPVAPQQPGPPMPQATVGGGFVPETATPFQPQAPAFTPSAGSPGSTKKPMLLVGGLVVLIGLLFGGFILFSSLSSGDEAKIGSQYLTALQETDTETLEKVVDPEITKLGDKIGELGGEKAKEGFYKGYAKSSLEEIGIGSSDEPSKIKVTKETDADPKYAYVTYKVGSKNATVIESYDGNKPKVLAAENGLKTYSTSKFKSQYKQYKEYMGAMGDMVDQIADGSGSNSKDTLEQLFSE